MPVQETLYPPLLSFFSSTGFRTGGVATALRRPSVRPRGSTRPSAPSSYRRWKLTMASSRTWSQTPGACDGGRAAIFSRSCSTTARSLGRFSPRTPTEPSSSSATGALPSGSRGRLPPRPSPAQPPRVGLAAERCEGLAVAAGAQRSLAMFASVAGTWLPFAFIFLAAWATGALMLTMPVAEETGAAPDAESRLTPPRARGELTWRAPRRRPTCSSTRADPSGRSGRGRRSRA